MSERRLDRRRGLALVATALTVLLMQFPVVLVELDREPLFYYRAQVFVSDVPLAAAVALALPVAWRRLRARSACAWTALTALALIALASAAHPALSGVLTFMRLAGAFAIALIAAQAGTAGHALIASFVGATAIGQTVLALGQLARGRPLGLPALGEFADPLLEVGTALAPRGTIGQPYVLAGLALVAAVLLIRQALTSSRYLPWLVAAAIALIPVGITYSRTAALGVVFVGATLVPRAVAGSVAHRAAIAALLLGAGVPALLTSGGWVTRAETTGTGRPIREILAVQALRLISEEPLVGVGPGRTPVALRDLERRDPGSVTLVQPVHDVPLLVAAEAGVAAGLAVAALLAITAWHARASLSGSLAFVAFAPFVLLDHYPYTYFQGLVLFGLWLGASRSRDGPDPGVERNDL